MDPLNAPAEYRESIRKGHARLAASVVISAALLVVGIGYLGSRIGIGTPEASPLLPSSSPAAAAATPGRSLGPTPAPTPMPTLAPWLAPSTTAELAPTGVLVADTGDTAIQQLAADADGTIWTIRAGGVVNVDPLTGRTRVWTLADDPAFAAASLAPARLGGVWLVNASAVRLFDGERFRAVIETPIPLWSVAEGLDGSLWAPTAQYGLIRWTDGVWASDPPGRPTRGAFDVVIDAAGRVWTHNFDPLANDFPERGVSVWDGIAWTTYTADDLPERPFPGGSFPSLVADGDGSVWAFGPLLARFDGFGWATHDVVGIEGDLLLSAVGDDGRLWFVREDCDSCGVQIQVYDGSAVTVFDDEDGLPGADDVSWPMATVLAGPGYVVAATNAGLYSFSDGAWERLEESSPPDSPAPEPGPRGVVVALAAVSRDEVWALASETGEPAGAALFRFDGEAWHQERLPVKSTIGAAVLAPNGELWLATGAGPLVRRNGAWIDLGDVVARVVAGPAEAGGECGGTVYVGGNGTAFYAGPRSGNQLVTLRPVGETWEPSLYPVPQITSDVCNPLLTVTADGTVWLLQRWWGNTLVRSAGSLWEHVVLPRMGEAGVVEVDPTAIVVDRAGSPLVAVNAYAQTAVLPTAAVLQPFNGQWAARGGDPGIPYIVDLALLPDGSPIAAGLGLATLDGQHWRQSWPDLRINAISVASDGTVWVAGPNVYRLPPSLP